MILKKTLKFLILKSSFRIFGKQPRFFLRQNDSRLKSTPILQEIEPFFFYKNLNFFSNFVNLKAFYFKN